MFEIRKDLPSNTCKYIKGTYVHKETMVKESFLGSYLYFCNVSQFLLIFSINK